MYAYVYTIVYMFMNRFMMPFSSPCLVYFPACHVSSTEGNPHIQTPQKICLKHFITLVFYPNPLDMEHLVDFALRSGPLSFKASRTLDGRFPKMFQITTTPMDASMSQIPIGWLMNRGV